MSKELIERQYWLIFFEDQDVRPEIYTDEAAARHRHNDLKEYSGYSCHLFAPAAELSRLQSERDELAREHANALGTAADLELKLSQSHVMYDQVIRGQRQLQSELDTVTRLWKAASIKLGEQRKAAFQLTAQLCALPETTLKDGHEYIRRDAAMDLIARWRREIAARALLEKQT